MDLPIGRRPERTDGLRRADDPLLVEDVLLLLTKPRSSVIPRDRNHRAVLGGAVYADLALRGLIESRPGVFSTYLLATRTPPSDPVLREAWGCVEDHLRNARTAVHHIGHRIRRPVLDRLIRNGHLHVQSRRVLRIPTRAVLAPGTDRRRELLTTVREVLIEGSAPDARTAALIALLASSGRVARFGSSLAGTEAEIRARRIEAGEWDAPPDTVLTITAIAKSVR